MELQKAKVLSFCPLSIFGGYPPEAKQKYQVVAPGDTNNCWAAVSHANPTGTLPPPAPFWTTLKEVYYWQRPKTALFSAQKRCRPRCAFKL